MNGSGLIIDLLYRNGIDSVFTVPGAHVGPFLNELAVQKKIRPVVCSHEAGAAFMADGYSRMKQVPGVVFTNGGPGLSNLITGLVVAKSEYIPLIIISGDIPVQFSSYQGFQEAGISGSDDLAISRNIIKFSSRVDHIEQLPGLINEALAVSKENPMGPVHLIIPHNLFQEKIHGYIPKGIPRSKTKGSNSFDIKEIESLLENAKRIVLYVGESLNNSQCGEALLSIAEKTHLPIVTTYGAKGIISEDHKLNFGNAGYAGRNMANQLILSDGLDGIIFFGVKLNERNTLNWHPGLLASSRSCIHIDYANSNKSFENSKHIKRIIESPSKVIHQVDGKIQTISREILADRKEWIEEIYTHLEDYQIPTQSNGNNALEPGWVVSELRNMLPANTSLFVDSGQHRLFPGFYWRVPVRGGFFNSAIVASTGWAIGAAVGAKIGNPDVPVVIITGDCCMRMHGFEIQTAVREKVPVIYYVFNNKSMGSVYQRMLDKNIPMNGLVNNYKNNWEKFADSIHAYGSTVRSVDELRDATRLALNRADRPTILDVSIQFPSYIPDNQYSKSAFA